MSEKNNIYNVKISEKESLYSYYMPFFIGGGLFLPTDNKKPIGSEIFLLVKLFDDEKPTPVVGTVAWRTPATVDGKRLEGFGVQFTRDEQGLRERIENALGVMLHSGKQTLTL